MRPTPHGEDAHDADLQRDHGARHEADGQIEAPARAVAERGHLLCVPWMASPSSLVKGTKGTILPL